VAKTLVLAKALYEKLQGQINGQPFGSSRTLDNIPEKIGYKVNLTLGMAMPTRQVSTQV